MLPVAAFPSTPLAESRVLSTLFLPCVYNKNSDICFPFTTYCQDRLIHFSSCRALFFWRQHQDYQNNLFKALFKKLPFQIHYLSYEAGHILFLVYSLASFHLFEAGCFGNLIYCVMWAVCPHKLVHFLYLFNWRLRGKKTSDEGATLSSIQIEGKVDCKVLFIDSGL